MSLSTDAERAEERRDSRFPSHNSELPAFHRQGPSAPASPEERIRAVFGYNHLRSLPKVCPGTLLTYHDHLAPRLTFPFRAEYSSEGESQEQQVVVLALVDPRKNRPDPNVGLSCVARIGTQKYLVPLMDLKVPEGHANFELIEDYWYWLWNWQR